MKVLLIDEVVSGLEYDYFVKIAEYTFDKLDKSNNEYEISLVLTDDDTIHDLNKQYRDKDRPTDVLSFELDDDIMLGDIIISIDTAKRQAVDNDILLDREVAFLFIHGILHLMGYDHELGPEEEKEMFELQENILKKLIEDKFVS